jgi:protein-tyrosine phosphatase
MVNLKYLKKLNISHNNISKLPDNFNELSNIEELNLSYNDFSEIPKIIFKIETLQKIFIDGNKYISNWPNRNIMENKKICIYIDNKPSLVDLWNILYYNIKSITIEWVVVYPSHIIDGLYIGSIKSASCEYVYEHCNIKDVFSIGRELNPTIFNSMNSIKISIDDDINEKIPLEYLELLNEKLQFNNCLVHCFMGISRSSSFVLAYLMKYYNLRLNDAYNFVKKKRNCIYPNDGFWRQLINLDIELFGDDNSQYLR